MFCWLGRVFLPSECSLQCQGLSTSNPMIGFTTWESRKHKKITLSFEHFSSLNSTRTEGTLTSVCKIKLNSNQNNIYSIRFLIYLKHGFVWLCMALYRMCVGRSLGHTLMYVQQGFDWSKQDVSIALYIYIHIHIYIKFYKLIHIGSIMILFL